MKKCINLEEINPFSFLLNFEAIQILAFANNKKINEPIKNNKIFDLNIVKNI